MPDLITFCKSLYYRFIEIKGNPRKKKYYTNNQNFNFLGGSFSNRENVRTPIQFKAKKENLTIIKSECSSKEPFFVLTAQLFEWSIETCSLMVKGAL